MNAKYINASSAKWALDAGELASVRQWFRSRTQTATHFDRLSPRVKAAIADADKMYLDSKPTTTAAVNGALVNLRNTNTKLYRGKGYYYFAGDDVTYASGSSVGGVFEIQELTIREWLQQYDEIAAESQSRRRS